jgi:hypothetical protein
VSAGTGDRAGRRSTGCGQGRHTTGRQLTEAEKAQRQAIRQWIGEVVIQYRAEYPGIMSLCESEIARELLLVRYGLKPWQSAIKEIKKWQAMSRFQVAARDRVSAALTGMSVQELSELREKDPEEAARRCAEALRLPKDFQDFLIDGALDDLFPRRVRMATGHPCGVARRCRSPRFDGGCGMAEGHAAGLLRADAAGDESDAEPVR